MEPSADFQPICGRKNTKDDPKVVFFLCFSLSPCNDFQLVAILCPNLIHYLKRLNKTIGRERREHEQTAKRLQGEIDRIYGWFPDTPQLIKWGEYCRSLGFTDKMARDLVNMRPVRFSGKLYSREHSQHFETEHSEARLLRDEKGPGGFQLFIDRIPILRWFRQKAKEFLEHIGIKIKDHEQGRGMRMR